LTCALTQPLTLAQAKPRTPPQRPSLAVGAIVDALEGVRGLSAGVAGLSASLQAESLRRLQLAERLDALKARVEAVQV
jgi:hypothetical protein